MLITITVNLPREFCLKLAKDRGLPYPLREADVRPLIQRAIRAGPGMERSMQDILQDTITTEEERDREEEDHRERNREGADRPRADAGTPASTTS